MNFFKRQKSDDSRARRSSRLLALRLQKLGVFTGIFAVIAAAGFLGYHSGSFTKINNWLTTKTLAVTADAGFKVKDILVTGRSHIPADELLTRLSIKENMPIFGVSITEAKESLAGISWVKDVSISRRLPDKIIVELKERTPAALWQYQKKISLIDQEGVVLTTDDLGYWQHLPLIVGEDAPKHVAELLGMLKAEPLISQALVSAVRVEGRRWDLRMQNAITVKLPEKDRELALRRLSLFEERHNIFGRNISGIDLRQPEKTVVAPVAENVNAADKKNKKTNI